MAAIVVMVYCLYLVLSLIKNVPGGVVGKTWDTLTALVGLITAGYFVTPFSPRPGRERKRSRPASTGCRSHSASR